MASTIPTAAKAWRYPPTEPSLWDSYHSLELRDIEVPLPGKGEILVKIHAVSLNRHQGHSIGGPLTMGPDGKGLIPTSDGAGEVVAVGEGVNKWVVGDRVRSLFNELWATGQMQRVLARTTRIRHAGLFDSVSVSDLASVNKEAATIPCAGITAFNALFESANTTQDSTVLVLGSGGVSVYAAQFAKAIGATVIATTSSKEKIQKYNDLGVDHVINYRDTPGWAQEVKRLTGGKGVDQVLEIGGNGTLMEAIKSVKWKGMVHIIGPPETPEYSMFELAFAIIGSEARVSIMSVLIHQVMLSSIRVQLNGIATGGKDIAERLDSFISRHKIKPLVDPRIFEWTEAKDAFQYLDKGSHFGKVVIKVD
ncbi:zinc-binding dehydrogenase domain-containing protein [Rhizoctonia solani AG-1 IA]|uniref:Zinc-binding dehydrogenase domain-containing protein n=1 Tax=Thanatephorus cucumeris (strain AG1-IA) TaxID=983506 RepID=L8X8A6_THACA|nr:zinc-binding dehydrogenase domain-containing protein [Rhizoctonia solani AG-1 IA]